MSQHAADRRLVAILSADAVGFSRLMAEDEAGTARTLAAYRDEVGLLVRQHRGRVVDSPGDNLLAEFPTATNALECAVEIQRVVGARNASLAADRKMEFRIGVHVGEVTVEPDRIYGNGVNIAARLQALAEPGGICVSAAVHEQVGTKVAVSYRDLGLQSLKNIPERVRAYHVVPSEPTAPVRKAVARRVAMAAAGAALVSIVVAAYLTFGGSPPKEAGAPLTSIAVLPFDDMSPGGDQKWLADGMAEELIETLSRIEALRVPARTSAFALRGKDIRTVGAELRVGSVVEGSVRRSDDQLRVTAQFIRVSDGSHLWSARYDRKLSDVFAIQSEIARAIAEAVRRELGIEYELSWFESIHEPSDVRAYELYKTGYHLLWPYLTDEGIRKAIEHFEQALAIDPDFAQARVELGFAYLGRWNRHRAANDLGLARAEAERVLAQDATNGGAHNLLAWVLQRRHQWGEAQRTVERGLVHNPGHSALLSQSSCLMAQQGKTADALVQARRAVDLDPRFALFHLGLGTVEVLAREFGAAVEDLEHAWELAPGASAIRTWLAFAYHLDGRDAEALEAAVRGLPPELSGMESAVRRGFGETGFIGAMRARHEWLIARNGTHCSDEAPGWGGGDPLATLGEGDAVFECLEAAIDRGDLLLYLRTSPVYDPYRADPRFAALLRRMNLAE